MRFGTVRAAQTLLAVAIAGVCGAARAQDSSSVVLEELILTASKREQTAKDVPIAVAVETGESLARKNIRDLEQLSLATPGLYVEQGGLTSTLAIRGLGSPGLDTVESSVGTYVDGVYLQRNRISRSPLFDMQRVEVLRGPQGTLYGRNTIAGALNLSSAKPTHETTGHLQVESGNYNQHWTEGYVSGSLSDSVQGRLAVMNSRRGAWMENDAPGGEDGGGQDSEAYRLSFRLMPADSLELLLKYEHQVHQQTGLLDQMIRMPGVSDMAALLPGFPEQQLDEHGNNGASGPFAAFSLGEHPGQKTSADLLSLQANYALNDRYSLISITGLNQIDASRQMDIDATPYDAIHMNGVDRFDSISQELRLEAYVDDNFSYIAGLYADQLKRDPKGTAAISSAFFLQSTGQPVAGSNPYAGIISPLKDTEDNNSWSLYWEGSWEFAPHWNAIGGLRFGQETKEIYKHYGYTALDGSPTSYTAILNNVGFELKSFAPSDTPSLSDERTEELVTPSFKLQYQPDADSMYYASASAGAKSGGYNLDDTQALDYSTLHSIEFDKEKAVALELGSKFLLLDGAAHLNVALFYTDFEDLQAATVSPQNTAAVINIPSAVSQGAEIDGAIRLTESLTVGGSYAYLDARYKDFDNAPCALPNLQAFFLADPMAPLANCTQSLDGDELQHAPENSASTYLSHKLPLGSLSLESNISLNFRDSSSLSLANDLYSDELTTLNARVTLASKQDQWAITAYGNNLTDEDGLVEAQRVSGVGLDVVKGIRMAPRSYALGLELKF